MAQNVLTSTNAINEGKTVENTRYVPTRMEVIYANVLKVMKELQTLKMAVLMLMSAPGEMFARVPDRIIAIHVKTQSDRTDAIA